MLRLGVCDAADFRPLPVGAFGRVRRALRNDHVSLQLLRTGAPASAAEIALFETVMLQMRLSSGVYRTTYRGRFAGVDPQIEAILLERFPHGAALDVHDWAASDCLTAAEWAVSLFEAFPRATLTASDLTLALVEVSLPDGSQFILEPGGQALQYIRRPFVIRIFPPEPPLLFLNRFLARKAAARLAALHLEIPEAWLQSDDSSLVAGETTMRKILMVHPEARALAARDARFRILRHSAFERLDHPVDVIRTMNVFHYGYFGAERLAEGARAVWNSLVDGGCWIVGRTLEEPRRRHEISVLERIVGGFRSIARVGDRSEIEPLVLGLSFR
jgi:hypothetical protein